jgi:hypothetical protein
MNKRALPATSVQVVLPLSHQQFAWRRRSHAEVTHSRRPLIKPPGINVRPPRPGADLL